MLPPSRTSVNLPYDHYALIYLDNMGKLRVAESPSIQNHHATIFTSEVRDSFLEILGAKIGYQKPTLQSKHPLSPRRTVTVGGRFSNLEEIQASTQLR